MLDFAMGLLIVLIVVFFACGGLHLYLVKKRKYDIAHYFLIATALIGIGALLLVWIVPLAFLLTR